MRLMHAIFVLLLLLLGGLLALMALPEPAAVTGDAHPLVDGMRIGGDGLARLGGARWLIAGLQGIVILLVYALIALSVAPARRTARFWVLLGVGCGLSLAVWVAMVLTYFAVLEGRDPGELAGYPAATAFMLYGVFLAGSYLCALYSFGFRRFVLTEEDEAAYEALRARAAVPRVPEHEAEPSPDC